MATATIPFTEAQLQRANHWLAFYRECWFMETPIRIHRSETDDGHGLGGPAFSHEFVTWLGQLCYCGRPGDPMARDPGCPTNGDMRRRNSEERLRVTRAFRRLRRVAPREFDALYLMCALDYSFEATKSALNERAIRLEKKERYDDINLLVLVFSGLDKVDKYY